MNGDDVAASRIMASQEPADGDRPARDVVVSVRGLGRTYGTGPGAVRALSNVSLDIGRRELVAILGPSGCGKSTLLNIIAGFDVSSEGRVEMNGEPVEDPSGKRGVVFQDSGALFPWFTVQGNIAFGPRAAGLPRAEIRRRVDAVLDLVRLKDFATKYPIELSGGMRQLVAIARVLVMDAELLLMDEPFAALDAITRQRMQRQLVEIWARSKAAILFITHSVDEAIYLGDRVVVMSGRPGGIRAVLDVPLPRPRNIAAPAFNNLRARALSLLDSASGDGRDEDDDRTKETNR